MSCCFMSGAGMSDEKPSVSAFYWTLGCTTLLLPSHKSVSSMFPLALANLWSWEGRQCLQLVRWHRWLHSWHWVSLRPWQSPWISQGGLQGVLSCHQPLPTSSGTGGGPIRENHHRPEPGHGARIFISQRTPGYKLLGKENEGC